MNQSHTKIDDQHHQLDITAPDSIVCVEIDRRRNVMYVHVDGYTALRVCRIPELRIEDNGGSP